MIPEPRVSVVIPCRNQGRFLAAAIDSVLAQTRPADEILVVDDGSGDDTGTVAAGYAPEVRVLRRGGEGLSAARNAGLAASSGAYIGFLDADDRWRPDFLAVLAACLDAEPALAAAYGQCSFVDTDGAPLPQQASRVVAPERLHEELIDGEFFPPNAVLVRRSALAEIGDFDTALAASEDWDLWLRLTARHRMAGVPRVLAEHRRHGDNMTADLRRMHDSQLMVVDKHFPDAHDQRRHRALAAVLLWQSMARYRRGEAARGAEIFARALAENPRRATNVDTFYALGCAEQSLGRIGDLRHFDVMRSAALVDDALRAAYGGAVPAAAAGTARFALGLLAYGSGREDLARWWLAAALRGQPQLIADRRWRGTFARALLGRRARAVLGRLRAHGARLLDRLAYSPLSPRCWSEERKRRFWNDQANAIHARWGRGEWDAAVLRRLIERHRVGSVLDVGCGSGRLFALYRRCGIRRILGIDVAAEAIAVARRDFPDVPTLAARIEDAPLPPEVFDLVVSNRVLQHLPAAAVPGVLARLCAVARLFYLNELSDSDRQAEQFFMFRHDYRRLFADLGWMVDEEGRIDAQTYLVLRPRHDRE